ncbi:N-6 DNA methylase [Caldithrix abyssi]|nr:N-6 DNA methylase [Caldithrix abyssi]
MKPEVRKMLEDMYEIFRGKFHDSVKAWDSLIEFLAVDNYAPLLYQLNHKFEWFFHDPSFSSSLKKVYDHDLLKSDYNDHLGEMYLEHIVGKKEGERKGLFLTPMNIAEAMAKMSLLNVEKEITILDPAVGTGRMLMAVNKQASNALMFGVDVDLRALRVAYTNFAIHGINGYLLHANSLEHEIDIATEEGRYNWQFANKWDSHWTELKKGLRKKEINQLAIFNGK